MKMLHIAIVTATFPPYKGGMGNVACHLARGLDHRGNIVRIFTPRYGIKHDFPEEEREDRLVVHFLRPLFRYGNAAVLPQLLWKLRGFDVIYLHYPCIGSVFFVMLARLFFKSKLVVHYHFDLVGTRLKFIIFYIYTHILLLLLVKASHCIIATSRDYLEHSHLRRIYNKYPWKFAIIPNGVSVDFFDKPLEVINLRSSLGIDEEERIVLFVGALDRAHYFKGVTVLLSAWQKILHTTEQPCTLIIVGKGGLQPSYEELSRQLNIKSSVKFVGPVSNSDLPVYYRLADVTVLPSVDKSEAFGLVLLESYASGTPVIASNLSGVRSLVQTGKTGWLVRPDDSNDLMKKLLEALKNRDKLKEMGERGRNFAKKYNWDIISKKLEKIIINITSKPNK